MATRSPPLWFVGIEVVALHVGVVGVALLALTACPSTDVTMSLAKVGLAESALFFYALAGWFVDVDPDPTKGYRNRFWLLNVMDLSVDNSWAMAQRRLLFWLLPGRLMAGAVVHTLAFVRGD